MKSSFKFEALKILRLKTEVTFSLSSLLIWRLGVGPAPRPPVLTLSGVRAGAAAGVRPPTRLGVLARLGFIFATNLNL